MPEQRRIFGERNVMKELAIDALKILALGVLVGTGVRLAEWAIPAPELRVIVCTMDDFDHVKTCTSAAELLKKHAGYAIAQGREPGLSGEASLGATGYTAGEKNATP